MYNVDYLSASTPRAMAKTNKLSLAISLLDHQQPGMFTHSTAPEYTLSIFIGLCRGDRLNHYGLFLLYHIALLSFTCAE